MGNAGVAEDHGRSLASEQLGSVAVLSHDIPAAIDPTSRAGPCFGPVRGPRVVAVQHPSKLGASCVRVHEAKSRI
jgi:hypothetical protein